MLEYSEKIKREQRNWRNARYRSLAIDAAILIFVVMGMALSACVVALMTFELTRGAL